MVRSPATRWVLLQAGEPLVSSTQGARTRTLARLSSAIVVDALLGPEPFFGQGRTEGTRAEQGDPVLEAARHRGPRVVFLGVHEPASPRSALPASEFHAGVDLEAAAARVEGTPYFALDVADVEPGVLEGVLRGAEGEGEKGVRVQFVDARGATSGFEAFDAAVFAVARSMLDWNTRYKFCPACGSPTYSLWAGWKLSCSSLLPWADDSARKPCPSAKGLHNFAHPRTDPVVIMLVIDESGEQILLGRKRTFPAGFYSCLAGFVEPGESFEDAVKREMYEEAGVKVWNVRYHSSQPWPYPANLMLGFCAYGDPSEPIRTDLDDELADARWFKRAEVQGVLGHPLGTSMRGGGEGDPPVFRVPGRNAIAGVLISDWAGGGMSHL